MKLRHYIKGSRKGKEANRLEREAMSDPFLAEALEGYERMPDAHLERIEVMRKRISRNTRKRHKTIYTWSAAASIIVVFALGGYFLLHKNTYPVSTQIAQQITTEDSFEEIAQPKEEQEQEQALPPPPAPLAAEDTSSERLSLIDEEASMAMTAEIEADIPVVARAKMASNQDLAFAVKEATMPHPVIGEQAYQEYIQKNRVIPTDNTCKEVKGQVVVAFFVNAEGRPYDLKIIRSLCPSLDREAIRLIENGPEWTTGGGQVQRPVLFE